MTERERILNKESRIDKFRPKLTERQKKEIVDLYYSTEEDISMRKLGEMFNCSHVAISKVINGYKAEVLRNG